MRQFHKSTVTPSMSKEHHFNARSALPQTSMQFPPSPPHTQTPFPSMYDTESFTTELGSSPDKYAPLIGEPRLGFLDAAKWEDFTSRLRDAGMASDAPGRAAVDVAVVLDY
ncbi:hypothetical protein W97_08533 [Coniosporium apollinis CBS 100218]|uniref:Uncharacterized protein n=1 Tax=Coniosporium apollinis (strain CBS 100218) TaxID=1168221 RepID=R7Z4R9_CONA1|nr:uncharacterized protein W97_08533 [Coniosporium apollinis CBS 100218]EON69175.1 hypothetical protein W97_08533 [Coniosporium apollinis CBS 100218]